MTPRIINSRHATGLALAVLCTYLIMSPVWSPGIAPRLYDDARYLELIVLLLVATQFCRRSFADFAARSWLALDLRIRLLAGVFVAGGALSAAVSGAAHVGALEVALAAQLLALFLVVSAVVRETGFRAESALSVAISAGAALIVLKFWVTYVLYSLEGKIFLWISPFLDFANVRFFSQYQAYVLFLVILPASMHLIGRTGRLLLYLVGANFWALHWMVASRATWIGVLVATIVVLVFKREGRLAWLRNQAAIAGAGAAIFLASSSIVAKAPETTPVPGVKSIVERGEGSMLERVALARSALAFVREHPFFGVGPGQFGLQQYSMPAAHPHNTPLQLASEYGIPAGAAGIALILTLVVFAVRSLRVEIPGNNDLVGASLAAALMAGITDSLFSGNLIMPHSQVLLCVVAGWLVGRSRLTSPAPITSPSRLQITRTTLVATALLAATVTTILALEYLPLARDIPAWSMRRNPHFWQYGRFDAW